MAKSKRKRGAGIPRNLKPARRETSEPRFSQVPEDLPEEDDSQDTPLKRLEALEERYPDRMSEEAFAEYLAEENRRVVALYQQNRVKEKEEDWADLFAHLVVTYGENCTKLICAHAPDLVQVFIEPREVKPAGELTPEQSARMDRLIRYILDLKADRHCTFVFGVVEGYEHLHLSPDLSPEERDKARQNLERLMIRVMEWKGYMILSYFPTATGEEVLNGFEFTVNRIRKSPPKKLRTLQDIREDGTQTAHTGAIFEMARVDLS